MNLAQKIGIAALSLLTLAGGSNLYGLDYNDYRPAGSTVENTQKKQTTLLDSINEQRAKFLESRAEMLKKRADEIKRSREQYSNNPKVQPAPNRQPNLSSDNLGVYQPYRGEALPYPQNQTQGYSREFSRPFNSYENKPRNFSQQPQQSSGGRLVPVYPQISAPSPAAVSPARPLVPVYPENQPMENQGKVYSQSQSVKPLVPVQPSRDLVPVQPVVTFPQPVPVKPTPSQPNLQEVVQQPKPTNPIQTVKPVSRPREINYESVFERVVKKPVAGAVIYNSLKLDSEKWRGLRQGLDTKDLYDFLKTSPMESVNETLLEGVRVFHEGPINNQDLKDDFMNNSKRYIKMKPSDHPLDKELIFSEDDRSVLEGLVDRAVKSTLTKTSGFFSKKEVYLFPPKSTLTLRVNDGDPCLEIKIYRADKGNTYDSLPRFVVTDSREKEVFRKYFLFTLISPDPIDSSLIPIQKIEQAHKAGQTVKLN